MTKPFFCGEARVTSLPANAISFHRYEQEQEGEENLKERTQTYVTEGCRSPTNYCEVYMERKEKLALALLMALVFRTNNHNLAVSLDYLTLIAHRLY